jgi:hypothetical protein
MAEKASSLSRQTNISALSLSTHARRFTELPDDILAELEKGFQGEPRPHLEHLMK